MNKDRGTGRTTKMLREALDELLLGQPRILIVGASYSEAARLFQEFLRMLPESPNKVMHLHILFQGSYVEFVNRDYYDKYYSHFYPGSIYIDHYSDELEPVRHLPRIP